MPECLPEQLLWARVGAVPARITACADGSWVGICGPHSRSSGDRQRRSSQATTRSTCIGSPEWLAQHSVTSASSRSEEHTSELQSLMRISYAVFCLQTTEHNLQTLPDLKHDPRQPA